MTRILCVGLVCVDFVYQMDAFPVRGDKHRARHATMIPGGGALIAASAIARLGGNAALAGVVGPDALGAFLRAQLHERGICAERVLDLADQETARSAILLTPDGERTIVNFRSDALFAAGLPVIEPFDVDGVLADTRWPRAAATCLREARSAGKPAVLDAEAPVRAATDALECATHVVFSEQGLADFVGHERPTALAEASRELGVWVAVTRGPKPVLCHDGERQTAYPVPPTHAVNGLGAGDVWHGMFTMSLAQGCAEAQAVRRANAAASLHVSVPLGEPSMLSAALVDAMLAED